ncbi:MULTISPECIES: hypothetical protein [Bacillus cereus group]|uniref:hypothetical protein n=1 Tax=Bacillus cereus group TaxID=86661 RepID=UPI0002F5892C|nr:MULTISPECIES: hypothetical protein [Bacillus cereus group]WJE35305.1 hypothetical protein QRX95_02590 [Bacillus mycoides]
MDSLFCIEEIYVRFDNEINGKWEVYEYTLASCTQCETNLVYYGVAAIVTIKN